MGYRIKRLQDFARATRESKALLERERWPQERLERFCHERLQQLARHARAHAPFWRKRIPSGRGELSDISPTSKFDLADNFDRMITDHRLRLDDLLQHLDGLEGDSLYLDEYRVMTSSGSSGRRAVFVYDRPGWQGIIAMFLRRSASTGMRPRLPRLRLAAIGGASPTHMSRRAAQALDVGVHRLLALSVTQPLDELVATLNEFRPDHLNGYPSIMGRPALTPPRVAALEFHIRPRRTDI